VVRSDTGGGAPPSIHAGPRLVGAESDAGVPHVSLLRLLQGAERVVALTGAGMSTASGIPDYRGRDGRDRRTPEVMRGSRIDDYREDPAVRRAAWQRRLTSPIWVARPNPAHLALAHLAEWGVVAGVVTQNIDGLHQRAGHEPETVLELHGTIWWSRCLDCGDRRPMAETLARVRGGESDPRCRRVVAGGHCRGVLTSATVAFGESLDRRVLERAEELVCAADVVLVAGTSLRVHPAAGLVPLARRAGAAVAVVNDGPVRVRFEPDVVVDGRVERVLPGIVAAWDRESRPLQ